MLSISHFYIAWLPHLKKLWLQFNIFSRFVHYTMNTLAVLVSYQPTNFLGFRLTLSYFGTNSSRRTLKRSDPTSSTRRKHRTKNNIDKVAEVNGQTTSRRGKYFQKPCYARTSKIFQQHKTVFIQYSAFLWS